MKKIIILCLIAVFGFCILSTVSPVLAQTPDGQTPAQETVCDALQEDGITKGLYGLCVAFCEAHDAADEDTPITGDQLSDILELSPNGRILKNYNRKKQTGDPDMPCVQVGPCPCWTADHIASIDGIHPDGSLILIQADPGQYAICGELGLGAGGNGTQVQRYAHAFVDHPGPDMGVCQAHNSSQETGVSEFVTLWYYGPGDSNNTLTSEQLDACHAEVLNCIAANLP